VVSNGTRPDRLESLDCLPTQLYLTLPAPDERTYKKTCAPGIKDGWKRINQSLELFSKLKTRRVIRLTLVRDLNMQDASDYAELIQNASPDWVEVKAFVSVGFSRHRLPYERMPLHNEIKDFSGKIADSLGWKMIDEKIESRVCLLGKKDSSKRLLS